MAISSSLAGGRAGGTRPRLRPGRHVQRAPLLNSRPFCDVLQETTEVIRYEQASAGDKYIAVAGSVQEPATLARLIEAHQFNAAAGEAFFHERMNRETSSEVGFYTATQRAGQLPQGMKPGETITFFTSSSDEMAAVTDAALYGSFATQHDVAIALAEACKGAGLQLLVRLHPHLSVRKNPCVETRMGLR